MAIVGEAPISTCKDVMDFHEDSGGSHAESCDVSFEAAGHAPGEFPTARSHGHAIELAPRVHAVLGHLISQARRIVSIDELRSVAWHNASRKPNRLAHYIAQARRALGDDGREPRVILTIYGVGYQYVGPQDLKISVYKRQAR